MSVERRTRGGPPKRLTGQLRVSSIESPWWGRVAHDLVGSPAMVDRILTIEELTSIVPSYPDGRRPRARTVARRLEPILELQSRGPNGSLGRGAVYKIVLPDILCSPALEDDGSMVPFDEDWINAAVEKMVGK